jgi:cytochrome c-type biogenesis protein CcmH/NrfG
MAKGKKGEAIAAYEKAASLDPKNAQAKELLAKAKSDK